MTLDAQESSEIHFMLTIHGTIGYTQYLLSEWKKSHDSIIEQVSFTLLVFFCIWIFL